MPHNIDFYFVQYNNETKNRVKNLKQVILCRVMEVARKTV